MLNVEPGPMTDLSFKIATLLKDARPQVSGEELVHYFLTQGFVIALSTGMSVEQICRLTADSMTDAQRARTQNALKPEEPLS